MPTSIFDSKIFNAEVFTKYVDRVPNLQLNKLIGSKAIRPRTDLNGVMADQVGGNYISTPLKGLINGSDAQNYDGSTDMSPDSTKTFMHSRVVTGRMKSWVENDFSFDLTGGEDFMANVAAQTAEYWQEQDQKTLLAILEGIFAMTGAKNLEFVNKHTVDVSNVVDIADSTMTGKVKETTINSAMQQAMGDNKGKFSLAIMHSVVSTNLENLKILVYMKYNDAEGMQRDATLGTIHGRLVLIDDSMPVTDVAATYALTTDTELNVTKTYYTKSGSVYTVVASPLVANIGTYYELAAAAYQKYTTYILGDGAIEYTNAGAKVPYEADRDPKKNGGQDTLYSRQRKCFAPYGISFTKAVMATPSPSDTELKNGSNWELVNTTGETKEYINHKAIPIARLISRG